MSGRHDFRELTKSFTPERRKRVETRKAELRAAMPLHEMGGRLNIIAEFPQGNVSITNFADVADVE